jgi:integrase
LATECTPPKVAQIPHIPMLKENNIRKGFFEHDQYQTLIDTLPPYIRPIAGFAYRTGWRKSEILNLTWDRIDFKENVVRLEAGETKNSEGRTIYLDSALRDIISEAKRKRRLGCPYVFHRDGERIQGFWKSWTHACEKAGFPGRISHDLRRKAVRNLVHSGVPEWVAMQISGHKTRSIFDRYNIVSPDDLKISVAKQEAYLSGI